MIIATGADDRFAMPMSVALYSALTNMKPGRDVSLYILDGGITPENRRRLADVLHVDRVNVRLQWVKPDLSRLSRMKTSHAFTQATYLRLLLPQLIPDEVNRVIYLDSDLVVEKDLFELWDAAVNESPALAVQDYSFPYLSTVDWAGDTYTKRNLPPDSPYCNAGLLVMNLDQWRSCGLAERAMEYMRQFPQYVRWADQDGINAVLAGSWRLLDDRWNVMLAGINLYGQLNRPSAEERRKAQRQLLEDPFVIHFTGPVKPWRFSHYGRAYSRFFHYLQQSRWFGQFGDIHELMAHTWKIHGDSDDWMRNMAKSVEEITEIVPEDAGLILVDESNWPGGLLEGRYVVPFPEANGYYAGVPADDAAAIREFERLRESGMNFIVFVEPALWWLRYFSGFNRRLRGSFRCVKENERLAAFEL